LIRNANPDGKAPITPVEFQVKGNIHNSRLPALRLEGECGDGSGTCPVRLTFFPIFEFEGNLSLGEPWGVKGKISVHQWDLPAPKLPEDSKNEEYLAGVLTADLEGSAEGLHPAQLKESLALRGAIDIRKGEFGNVNFIKETLTRISPIPGFSRLLD